MALLATIVAIALPAGASCSPACEHRVQVRMAMEACAQDRPRSCVRRAFLQYDLGARWRAWMVRVASCESGWNPLAISPGGHLGLFQFHPATWAGTPYGTRDALRAKWSALAAAWMVTRGRAGEWSCQ